MGAQSMSVQSGVAQNQGRDIRGDGHGAGDSKDGGCGSIGCSRDAKVIGGEYF